jgi:hypothetical protein
MEQRKAADLLLHGVRYRDHVDGDVEKPTCGARTQRIRP